MNRKKGFTLIELLVVIAIIGILASIVLASLSSAQAKARDAKRTAEMKQVALALELYYDSKGSYPSSAANNGVGARESSCYTGGSSGVTPGGWATPLQALVTDGDIASLPIDPKNTGSATASNNPNYCYVYHTDTALNDIYASCINTQTGEVLEPGNYAYFLFYSLENPPANRYKMNWNGSSNPPSNTCLPGPHL
jgi:prepilin-type N-terminal cleavage/methylation domain-containing protein